MAHSLFAPWRVAVVVLAIAGISYTVYALSKQQTAQSPSTAAATAQPDTPVDVAPEISPDKKRPAQSQKQIEPVTIAAIKPWKQLQPQGQFHAIPSGRVEFLIANGQTVSAGETIAVVGQVAARQRLVQQKLAVSQTKLKLAQARLALAEHTLKTQLALAEAELAVTVAKFKSERYRTRDLPEQRKSLRGRLALAQRKLELALRRARGSDKLADSGLISLEQLGVDKGAFERSQTSLATLQRELQQLNDVISKRRQKELDNQVATLSQRLQLEKRQAALEESRQNEQIRQTSSSLALERQLTTKLAAVMTDCTIQAQVGGTVIYSRETLHNALTRRTYSGPATSSRSNKEESQASSVNGRAYGAVVIPDATESQRRLIRQHVAGITFTVESSDPVESLAEDGSSVMEGSSLLRYTSALASKRLRQKQDELSSATTTYQRSREQENLARQHWQVKQRELERAVKQAQRSRDEYLTGQFRVLKGKCVKHISQLNERLQLAKQKLKWSDRVLRKRYITKSAQELDSLSVRQTNDELTLARFQLQTLETIGRREAEAKNQGAVSKAQLELQLAAKVAQLKIQLVRVKRAVTKAQLADLEAVVQQCKVNVTACEVRAPLSGIVSHTRNSRGVVVSLTPSRRLPFRVLREMIPFQTGE